MTDQAHKQIQNNQQTNLRRFWHCEWSDLNQMPINKEKSVVLSISNKVNPICFDYCFMDGSSVSKVVAAKDLGVTIDSKYRFSDHYETIVNKAFRALGFLIRTSRHFATIDALVFLYNCMV